MRHEMKNYFHGGIVMNGFLKHPYFAGTFRNGRNSSQAQKDFVGPGRHREQQWERHRETHRQTVRYKDTDAETDT